MCVCMTTLSVLASNYVCSLGISILFRQTKVCVCERETVCVSVCVREREREKEREVGRDNIIML